MWWAVLIAVCAVTLGVVVMRLRRQDREIEASEARRRERLAARPVLAQEEWAHRYLAPAGLTLEPAWTVVAALAKSLGCHPSQLLPSDTFASELALDAPSPGLIDDDVAMLQFTEHDLRVLLSTSAYRDVAKRAASCHSLGEFLRAIQDAVQSTER